MKAIFTRLVSWFIFELGHKFFSQGIRIGLCIYFRVWVKSAGRWLIVFDSWQICRAAWTIDSYDCSRASKNGEKFYQILHFSSPFVGCWCSSNKNLRLMPGAFLGLVHICRQNRELVSIDKVLRLFIDKLQVWTRDKKFQIMLDLFHNSLPTKSAICPYKCVLSSLGINTYGGTEIPVFRRCAASKIECAVRIISITKK